MPAAYAELGARSNFTLLDGASHPAELVVTARKLGHAGLGICDVNSLAGVVRGHVAAKEVGLPYLIGARLRLEDGAEYLAWPTDRASYGRLARLLSLGGMRAPKGNFSISRQDMAAHAEGWCLASIPPVLPDPAFVRRFREDEAALNPKLALPLFCAAACRHDGRDAGRLHWLAGITDALLAWNDVRYHQPDRRRLADVVTAIRLGRSVETLGRMAEANGESCLKPLVEMERLFTHHPEALANTLRVLQAGQGFSLDQLRHEYPDEILEKGYTPQQTLERRVAASSILRWPRGVPEDAQKQIDKELRLIEQLQYAPYFLTVDEIVRFARSKGILCQGRGSAANSAICYVLGITSLDPTEHELLFERFVSASRDEPPDIDVDFEHERREEVIQHIYERYGRQRAAIVATVIRYRTRSAVREVGKALGLSEDVTARLSKASWGPGRDCTLADIAQDLGLDPTDQRLALALELAEEIRDFPRHLATHVGGFVISRGPLVETAVITHAAMENRTVLEWDKDDIDALGLLKMDVLGLGMLSCLRRSFDLLRQYHKRGLILADVPRDCPETYAMLRKADTIGVFQVESRAQMSMLPRLRPKQFYDLVIQIAIVRPGPIQGDMVHPYLRRRAGLEKPIYPGPSADHGETDELEKVLVRTLGVPLFQEQAMRVAMVAAKFTPEEADKLRRSMATFKQTGGVSEYHDRLVGGMVRRGYDPEMAERVFKQIEGFGSYGFPESHAASFALLAYASAWLKCHHPTVFAAALLNSLPMGFYAPAQIVRDARQHGVAIRPLDVNASEWDCTLEPEVNSAEGFALRLGMRLANGLSTADATKITEARRAGNGSPFASPEEVARRAGIDRKAMEALAQANAFASMGTRRRQALWAAKGVEQDAPDLLRTAVKAAAAGEPPLLREPAPILPEETEGQSVVLDYATTGLTLRRHPLALMRAELQALGCIDTRQLATRRAGSKVKLAGLVLMRQRPGTSKGVIFLTVEDEHGIANLVVWADIAARDRLALIGAKLMLVEGRVERQTEYTEQPIIHVICLTLTDRSDLMDKLLLIDEADAIHPGAARLPGSRDFR
jgi:error-prone DNA polymerase